MNIKEKLEQFGFLDKEIKVYLALIEFGSSVVSDIAKKAGINRSTTYIVLDALAKRNLLNIADRRGVKIYSAASPEHLTKYFEGLARQYSQFAGEAKELAPKLKPKINKSGAREKPRVQFFEGKEGMKTVYQDALSSLETVRSYAFKKSVESPLPHGYFDNLAKKKIKIKALFPETSEVREFASRGSESGGKIYDFSPDISVYDNKIVFTSPKEGFGLIIESRELADALKKAFDLSWTEAKRLGGKPLFGAAAA